MKVKSVRYGRVVPARDGTKFSTERCEVEVEAEDGESFETLLARAQALVAIGVGELNVDELRREKAELDVRLAALGKAGL